MRTLRPVKIAGLSTYVPPKLLTNDDLDQVEGNATKLIGRLQERYGYAKEEAEAEFNRFLSRYPEPAPR